MTELSVLPHLEGATAPAARILVDGEWREGGGPTIRHVHPATEETVFEFASASVDDVRDAVAAARRAFDDGPWARLHGQERSRLLRRVAELIHADADNLNALLSLDNATPSSFVGYYQMGAHYAADQFGHFAGWIDKITGDTFPQWEATQPFCMTLREPVGVVGVITPWNAPMSLFAQKVAPALAAGCTVVAKPSELAPLTSVRMCELIAEADLPPGVFNAVLGAGDPVGAAIVDDPRVDKMSFTGSRAVGATIAAKMGERIGGVTLELGGKSPALIFPDAADLGGAVGFAAGNAFLGMSGQVCVCQSRILVHHDVHDEVMQHLTGFTAFASYGDPFDPAVTAAPMISATHRDRVMQHIERAVDGGAELAAGGGRPAGAPGTGFFVEPTIVVNTDNTSTIARDEVFGPVVTVIPFSDEDEAVAIANDTEYGLAAAVYTADLGRALRLTRRLRAGNVGVNCWTLEPHVPFGGIKQSGAGRENGEEGLRAYLDTKSVFMTG